MSVQRVAALTAVLCAAAVGALALPWFTADLGERTVSVSATDASLLAWLVVPVSIAVVATVIVASRPGALATRRSWRLLIVAAGLASSATMLTLIMAVFPSIAVQPVGIDGGPQVAVHVAPPIFVTLGALSASTALICLWLTGIANALDDPHEPAPPPPLIPPPEWGSGET